jgi:alkaline phosphatase D
VLPGGRETEWAASAQAGGGWRRLIEGGASPLCEVLGPSQRRWLRSVLGLDDGGDSSSSGSSSKGQQQQRRQSQSSPLKLVASGSVLAGSLGHGSPADGPGTECGGGDELSCWHRAQVNLLHTLANASGCVVVLTGDFHFSDIKQIRPGAGGGGGGGGGGSGPATNYSYYLNTEHLAKPVWQVMASGAWCVCFARVGGGKGSRTLYNSPHNKVAAKKKHIPTKHNQTHTNKQKA